MIDRQTIKFFQNLPKLEESNNNFFEAVFDIKSDILATMYNVAKTINIAPRGNKRYRWYIDDHTGNLYSKDLCNINGVPAHDHYKKMFPGAVIENTILEWEPAYTPFKEALAPIRKQWRWVMIVRIDPLGWWGPHFNIPGPEDHDDYSLYWIPLNPVKNRFFGATDIGYFEPVVGKGYIQRGHKYRYSTINLGTEPMYNITGVCIK